MRSQETYSYRAATASGRVVSGSLEAQSLQDASTRLIGRGLSPVRLEVSTEAARRQRPASRRDLAIAFRSVAALVGAGLPLDRALAATAPVVRGPLHEALGDARVALAEGRSLAEAFTLSRGLIPELAVALIRAGERTGQLPGALDQVASQLERDAVLAANVRQALAYPLMLAVGGCLSVGIITTVVIPRFALMLGDLGQTLPLSTAVLLAFSVWMRQWWLLILLVGVAVAGYLVMWARSPVGRVHWDTALLALPAVGPIRWSLAASRLLRALGGALRSGMPLVPAIGAASEAAADAAIAVRAAAATEAVLAGRPLTESLDKARVIPDVALQLLGVGENSGQLAVMAERAGEVTAQDAERKLQQAVRLIEPLLILAFGGLIAFVAAALLQAVYSLRPGV